MIVMLKGGKRRFIGGLADHGQEATRRRDEDERRQRVMVITELDAGDPEANSARHGR